MGAGFCQKGGVLRTPSVGECGKKILQGIFLLRFPSNTSTTFEIYLATPIYVYIYKYVFKADPRPQLCPSWVIIQLKTVHPLPQVFTVMGGNPPTSFQIHNGNSWWVLMGNSRFLRRLFVLCYSPYPILQMNRTLIFRNGEDDRWRTFDSIVLLGKELWICMNYVVENHWARNQSFSPVPSRVWGGKNLHIGFQVIHTSIFEL